MDPTLRKRMKTLAEGSFDSSVLGLTKAELDDMDDEERLDALADSINRAADQLQAIVGAFGKDLSVHDRDVLANSAKDLIRVAKGTTR